MKPFKNERTGNLAKWFLPHELPDTGGYHLELQLKEPSGLFSDGKVISIEGFIGSGDEVLALSKQIWKCIEDAKAQRLKSLTDNKE